jgi:hypothetical protein
VIARLSPISAVLHEHERRFLGLYLLDGDLATQRGALQLLRPTPRRDCARLRRVRAEDALSWKVNARGSAHGEACRSFRDASLLG